MKCWYRLKIDTTNSIRNDYKFPIPNNPLGIWSLPVSAIFNDSWLKYIESNGLILRSAMLFYRAPYANAPTAHIDLAKSYPSSTHISFSNFALNWTIGGAGSEMVWYNKPAIKKDIRYTSAGNPFIDWDFSELVEIDRLEVGACPTLVRVNTPHTVSMKAEPRWCISVRTSIKDNVPWETIVEYMRSKNLLQEK
jgi:hypothetical protein